MKEGRLTEEVYIGPMMKKIAEEFERQINEEVKKYHLTLTQSRVILFLAGKENQTATQKELEDWLQVSHPTTVTIVKSMLDKGMLKTGFSAEDKRMKLLTLTWGNEEIYQDLTRHAYSMEDQLLKGFSEAEAAIFKEYMKKAYRNMGLELRSEQMV